MSDKPKKPKPRKKWRTDKKQDTISAIIEYTKSEIDCFVEDISNWYDNMGGTALENTEKYEQVGECNDALQTVQQNMEDVETNFNEMPMILQNVVIQYQENHRYGRKPDPRWMIMSNVLAQLEAVRDFANSASELSFDELQEALNSEAFEFLMEVMELDKSSFEEIKQTAQALSTYDFSGLVESLDSVKDEAEGIEFPGMY